MTGDFGALAEGGRLLGTTGRVPRRPSEGDTVEPGRGVDPLALVGGVSLGNGAGLGAGSITETPELEPGLGWT